MRARASIASQRTVRALTIAVPSEPQSTKFHEVLRASTRIASDIRTGLFLPAGASDWQLPELSLPRPAKIFAAGIAAGGSGSVVGMGGAFVAIPALTSKWIGLSQHQAQATSLAAVLATGAGGAASFALAGSVDFPVALAIAGSGIVTANLGARLASQLPGHTMKGLLGAFMVATAGAVVMRPMFLQDENSVTEEATFTDRFAKLTIIGCGVGMFAGVFGVGGGAITVPAIAFFLPELSHHEALGTSCAAMILPAVSGLCRHASTGVLVPSAALPLAIGTACGAFFGARYVALEMDEGTLRNVFAVLMALLGARTMQSAAAMRVVAGKFVQQL